jgi:hypothetical protein
MQMESGFSEFLVCPLNGSFRRETENIAGERQKISILSLAIFSVSSKLSSVLVSAPV